MERHISQRFDSDLEALKSQVLEMGGIVEQQIIDSVKAIAVSYTHLTLPTKRIV